MAVWCCDIHDIHVGVRDKLLVASICLCGLRCINCLKKLLSLVDGRRGRSSYYDMLDVVYISCFRVDCEITGNWIQAKRISECLEQERCLNMHQLTCLCNPTRCKDAPFELEFLRHGRVNVVANVRFLLMEGLKM